MWLKQYTLKQAQMQLFSRLQTVKVDYKSNRIMGTVCRKQQASCSITNGTETIDAIKMAQWATFSNSLSQIRLYLVTGRRHRTCTLVSHTYTDIKVNFEQNIEYNTIQYQLSIKLGAVSKQKILKDVPVRIERVGFGSLNDQRNYA